MKKQMGFVTTEVPQATQMVVEVDVALSWSCRVGLDQRGRDGVGRITSNGKFCLTLNLCFRARVPPNSGVVS